jgi:hypothetical protein
MDLINYQAKAGDCFRDIYFGLKSSLGVGSSLPRTKVRG